MKTAAESLNARPSPSPKAYLSRRYRLSASHRLHSDDFTADQNRATYGKCNNPHGHGHNYIVEVTVAGPVDATSGMVCDLAQLDAFAQTNLLDRFDTMNLNTLRSEEHTSELQSLRHLVCRL